MLQAFIFDSVGFGEWFVLLAVVLIVMGPRRLPAAARNIGKWYNKVRRVADEFKRQLMEMDTGDGQTLGDAVNEVRNSLEADAEDLKKSVNEVDGAFKVEGDEANAEPGGEYGVDEDGVYRDDYYDAYNGVDDETGEGIDPVADAEPENESAAEGNPSGSLNPSALVQPAEEPAKKRDLSAIRIVVSELPGAKRAKG